MGVRARGSMAGGTEPLRDSVAARFGERTLFCHKIARWCLAVKTLHTHRLPLAAALALTIAALAFAVGGLLDDAGAREGRIAAAPPHAAGAFSGISAPRLR